MDDRTIETIRLLPRGELEAIAWRAMVRLRDTQKDAAAGNFFSTILLGFLLGALVASAAFMLGAGLR